MATPVEDSSSASSNSSPDDDAGTPSDFCVHCKAELDPLKLIVNVKTFNITVGCDCCGEINKAGKWTGALSFPKIILRQISVPFQSRQSRALLPTIPRQEHLENDACEKKFKCSFCKFSSNFKSNVTKHERAIHMGEKLFSCLYCDKKYSSKDALVRHMRTHTGEKPFKCKDCGKKFATSSNLIRHNRIHTGEKPFECKDCGKKFADSSSLTHHNKIHTGEKPFECEDCGKKFNRKDYMMEHISSIHTGEKPFECEHCGKKFVSKRKLNNHIRSVHNSGNL